MCCAFMHHRHDRRRRFFSRWNEWTFILTNKYRKPIDARVINCHNIRESPIPSAARQPCEIFHFCSSSRWATLHFFLCVCARCFTSSREYLRDYFFPWFSPRFRFSTSSDTWWRKKRQVFRISTRYIRVFQFFFRVCTLNDTFDSVPQPFSPSAVLNQFHMKTANHLQQSSDDVQTQTESLRSGT